MKLIIENSIIIALFLMAVMYLFNSVRKNFSAKKTNCAKGCGGACSSIDFEKIQAEITKKEALPVEK